MGRYDALTRHLADQHATEVELSFMDLERVIGGPLPKSASRAVFWANEAETATRMGRCQAWTAAGFDASLVPGAARVRFLRHGYKVVSRSEGATFIAKENPSKEEIAETKRAFDSLIKLLARTAADASVKHGIELDMNDPEVAHGVIRATFDGLFLSPPIKQRGRSHSGGSKP